MALRKLSACFPRYAMNSVRFSSKYHGGNRKKLSQRHERNLNRLFGVNTDATSQSKKWKKNAVPIPYGTGNVTAASQRRAQQLSVYLLEHICNAFYQGDVCPEINENNLEIEKVKVSPDLGHLNVFWNATGKLERDVRVEGLLESSKRDLRSLLTQKQLMGRIPPITFVKNTTNSQLQMVEELLKRADLGPDHVPTDLGRDLKTPIDLTKYRSTSSEKIRELPGGLDYVYAEGPGGTKELLWNELDSTENLEHRTESEQVTERMDKMSEQQRTASSAEFMHVNSKFRYDIYDLDRDELLEKVLHIKRKAKDRSYKMPSCPTSEGLVDMVDEVQNKNINRGTLHHYLAKKQEKDFRRQKRRNLTFTDLEDDEMYGTGSNDIHDDHNVHDDDTDYFSQK